MEIPSVIEELNKYARTSFRNIGPVMPIKDCECKWEYSGTDGHYDREVDDYCGYEIYECSRCGSDSFIDCIDKENLIRLHYLDELHSLELIYSDKLLLEIGVYRDLLSKYEPIDDDYILLKMIEAARKKGFFDD